MHSSFVLCNILDERGRLSISGLRHWLLADAAVTCQMNEELREGELTGFGKHISFLLSLSFQDSIGVWRWGRPSDRGKLEANQAQCCRQRNGEDEIKETVGRFTSSPFTVFLPKLGFWLAGMNAQTYTHKRSSTRRDPITAVFGEAVCECVRTLQQWSSYFSCCLTA